MKKIICCAAGLACTILVGYWYASAQSSNAIPDPRPRRFHQASNLPDLSGLVWLEGNRFLAVHDAKVEDEIGNPRISLIELPANSKGVRWLDRTPNFHELPSNDLESAARIPATQDVLLVESGDSLGDVGFQRIFKARVIGNSVHIVATAQWPVPINNVEASAVVALGPLFVFLFAERAQNLPSTELWWALFDPATLRFGSFASVTFANPNPAAFNRPLVAMDVDSAGQIYVAAAFDAEAAGLPDPDNGPFASAVYRIGVVTESLGIPTVQLFESPLLEGSMDGFKVESIAIREDAEHGFQIFVGLDDENYGATLRLLPEPPQDVSHR
jgi:hypothetical protein